MTVVNDKWIEERRRLENELRRAHRLEAMAQLAAGIAHDCNNLLVAIQGHAQLLLTSLRAHDPIRADVEEIVKAANRAAGLMRQLLTVGGAGDRRPGPVDLGVLVRGVERLLRRAVASKVGLRIATSGELLVEADEGQLEQVVLNLVLNARDATPWGGTITIRTEEALLDAERDLGRSRLSPGRYAHLAVRDTGSGMSADVLRQAFEPFFTTKEDRGGTGLGLATARAIVEQFGGAIALESEPDAGTVASVYLPLAATLTATRT